MQFRHLLAGLGALFLLSGAAHAQPSGISQKVGVCDVKTPTNCIKPNSDGSINVSGSISASTSATASANPTPVVAGTGKPLNIGLFSNLFMTPVTPTGTQVDLSAPSGVLGTDGATIAAKANPFDVEINGGVAGVTASGASLTENPLAGGCLAKTAAPTAVTDGQKVNNLCGVEGKQIVLPYAIKELQVRGSTGAITNTTQTSIIASAGGSLKNYITAVQCANSGASTSILTFTDAAATVLINPAGGGGSWVFPVPLATAAATAFQVTPGTASTSQYCSAQGYTGP